MIVKSILSDCSLLRLFYHLRPTLARGFELYPPPRLPLLFLLDENEDEDDDEDEYEDEEDIEPLDFELTPSTKPPVPLLLLLLSLPPLHDDDQDPEIQESP